MNCWLRQIIILDLWRIFYDNGEIVCKSFSLPRRMSVILLHVRHWYVWECRTCKNGIILLWKEVTVDVKSCDDEVTVRFAYLLHTNRKDVHKVSFHFFPFHYTTDGLTQRWSWPGILAQWKCRNDQVSEIIDVSFDPIFFYYSIVFQLNNPIFLDTNALNFLIAQWLYNMRDLHA